MTQDSLQIKSSDERKNQEKENHRRCWRKKKTPTDGEEQTKPTSKITIEEAPVYKSNKPTSQSQCF
jgi:hypothetical protein